MTYIHEAAAAGRGVRIDMATPNFDDGVPVDLGNSGGGSGGGGGLGSTMPGGQNGDKVTDEEAQKKSAKGNKKGFSCSDSFNYALLGLVILVLYYVFVVYYMVNFTEKWWHAALGIGVSSASLVLSIFLVARQYVRTPGEQNVKPHQDSDGDLGRMLLASENLQDNA